MSDLRVQKKKSFSISDFKQKNKVETILDKPEEWIKLSPAFQKNTGLPGVPKGYVVLSRGFTNTGKSTTVFEAAVSAQSSNVLPIIIDTENNLNFKHLALMGFDFEDDNKSIIINNEILRTNWGQQSKDRKDLKQATIEDVADCINFFLDEQEAGNLETDILFIWDSIGSLNCAKSVRAEEKDTANNNMWNAGALESAFKGILNDRIPSSRKVNKKFTNTLIAVQKIWIDSQSGGMPVVKHKGGEAFSYPARLIFHHGGIMSHGAKKVSAVKEGKDIAFGIQTNLTVYKNQVTGVNYEGAVISTPHGFIETSKESIDAYKKLNMDYFKNVLNIDGDFTIEVDTKELEIFEES